MYSVTYNRFFKSSWLHDLSSREKYIMVGMLVRLCYTLIRFNYNSIMLSNILTIICLLDNGVKMLFFCYQLYFQMVDVVSFSSTNCRKWKFLLFYCLPAELHVLTLYFSKLSHWGQMTKYYLFWLQFKKITNKEKSNIVW